MKIDFERLARKVANQYQKQAAFLPCTEVGADIPPAQDSNGNPLSEGDLVKVDPTRKPKPFKPFVGRIVFGPSDVIKRWRDPKTNKVMECVTPRLLVKDSITGLTFPFVPEWVTKTTESKQKTKLVKTDGWTFQLPPSVDITPYLDVFKRVGAFARKYQVSDFPDVRVLGKGRSEYQNGYIVITLTDLASSDLEEIVAHEMGHAFLGGTMPSMVQSQYLKTRKDKNWTQTAYAASNADEWFACLVADIYTKKAKPEAQAWFYSFVFGDFG